MQHNTFSVHKVEQKPSGPGHRTSNTPRRAYTRVNRSQVAQDTPHTAQDTERAQK